MRSIHLHLIGAREGARTYHFRARLEDGSPTTGWAYATVNDTTGELTIASDWGNFTHLWSPTPETLGAHNLTDFIAGCNDPHYLTNKLVPGDGTRFSPTKTTEGLIEDLKERRRDNISTYGRKPDLDYDDRIKFSAPARYYLTHEKFEEICEHLRELANDLEHGNNGDAACALYFERLPHDIHRYLSDMYERSATEETWDAKHLRTILVPAVIEACKGEMERRFRELDAAAQIVLAMLDGAHSRAYRHSLPICACGPVKSNLECRGASTGSIGTRCAYWGSLCGAKPGARRHGDGHGSQTDANRQVYRQTLPECSNYAPAGFSGHWRDWHRGHGCRLDPDAVAAARAAEEAARVAAKQGATK
jgi:hypothetical protein